MRTITEKENSMEKAKKAKVFPRKLARQMARATLDKQKVTGYNKEKIGIDGKKQLSIFSQCWRELSAEAAGKPIRKKEGGRK